MSRLERGEEPDLKTFMVVCDWLQVNASQFLVCNSDGNDASGMANLAVYSNLMRIQSDVNFLVKIFQPSADEKYHHTRGEHDELIPKK